MFALKALSHEGVESALAKAERYRLLNEPSQAESICLDILGIEPDNQPALICYILAQTEQKAFSSALGAIAKLGTEYDRCYYSGIVWERRARSLHDDKVRGAQSSVYEWMAKALEYFDHAATIHPAGNDDAVLRWNTCVRFLQKHPSVAPRMEEIPEPIVSE